MSEKTKWGKDLTASKRKFEIVIANVNEISEVYTLSLFDLMDSGDENELLYSLRENIDCILDLKRYESIYFQPNRDDENSKGIILRIT